MPIALRHFVKFDNSKVLAYRKSHANADSKSLSDRVWKHRWTLEKIATTKLSADKLRILPVVRQIREQLCDAERMRKRAMLLHKTSQRGIVTHQNSARTKAKLDPVKSPKGTVKALVLDKTLTLEEQNKFRSTHITLARVLRRMATIYQKIGEKNLAFNATQIALMYLDLPGATAESFSFSEFIGYSEKAWKTKLDEFKTWYVVFERVEFENMTLSLSQCLSIVSLSLVITRVAFNVTRITPFLLPEKHSDSIVNVNSNTNRYVACKQVDTDLARDTLLGGLSLYEFLLTFLEETDPMWTVAKYSDFLLGLDNGLRHHKSKLIKV